MGRKITALSAAAICCILMVSGAKAQAPNCGPHDEIIKVLTDKYQEHLRSLGMINDKAVMEVYRSSKGTWTFIVTNNAGLTCIVAAGDNWDDVPPPPEGKGT